MSDTKTSNTESDDETKHISLNDYFPPPKDGEVEAYIGKASTAEYKPADGELISRDGESNNDDASAGTFLSFGDDGTTATVTKEGGLVQVSRYLGHGSSSIYALNRWSTPEPFMTKERIRSRNDLLIRRGGGFGCFPLLSSSQKTTLSWVHNRWPRMTTREEKKWELTQQWAVYNGAVIQKIVVQNLGDEEMEFRFMFYPWVEIHELDYASGTTSFAPESTVYESGGPGGFGFVRIQEFSEESQKDDDSDQPDAVAAVWSWMASADENPLTIQGVDIFLNDRTVPSKGTFQLILGCKLVLLEKGKEDWRPLVLRAEDMNIDQLFRENASTYTSLNRLFPEEYFSVGRNVEHMLSVCMIPVRKGLVWDSNTSEATGKDDQTVGKSENTNESHSVNDDEVAMALTCGDIWDHRISVSASFFAFKYLVDVARLLSKTDHLRDRIQRQCLAHLRWVFTKTQKIEKSHFARNYWVNGTIIPTSPELLPDGLTDTPFQILKAYAYYEAFPEEQEKVLELLKNNDPNFLMKWVEALDQKSKCDSFVWPHSQRAGMDYFRLDDHVWIWNAISAISTLLNCRDKPTQSTMVTEAKTDKAKKNSTGRIKMPFTSFKDQNPEQNNESKSEGLRLQQKYEPKKVKREILQRFTTVNDATKLRMLAVTRSPRETRFNFHSRDTALFYKIVDTKLLDLDDQRWVHLMKLQKRFAINQERESDNPLRYGLAMLMAHEGFSISGQDRTRVQDNASRKLATNMVGSGLFPGQFEGVADSEKINYDFNHLLHVSFETPYLLLTLRLEQVKPEEAQKEREDITGNTVPDSTVSATDSTDITKNTTLLNGTVPFNDQIDSKSIVDLKEEWLYNYPVFLNWTIPQSIKSPRGSDMNFSEKKTNTNEEENSKWMVEDSSDDVKDESIVRKAILGWWDTYYTQCQYNGFRKSVLVRHAARTKTPIDYQPQEKSPPDYEDHLIDVGKKQPQGKNKPGNYDHTSRLNTRKDHWNQLKELRDAANAKKRFLWCQNPPLDYVLMCYLASPQGENASIGSFFDRHAQCATYFSDKASRVRNTWETEFHCSFLQLEKEKEKGKEKGKEEEKEKEKGEEEEKEKEKGEEEEKEKEKGKEEEKEKEKGEEEEKEKEKGEEEEKEKEKGKEEEKEKEKGGTEKDYTGSIILEEDVELLPKLNGRQILRASASFRFHGDIFDRFWTCHHIESYPNPASDRSMEDFLKENKLKNFFGNGNEKVWEQRKVLELLLFNRILEESNRNILEIAREIRNKVNKKQEFRNSKEYFDARNNWEMFQKILQRLEEDLDKILDNVKNWNSRVEDRRTEQPRWTYKDEKKHRDAINIALAKCQRMERELKNQMNTVRSLMKRLNYIRDEAKNRYEASMDERVFRQNDNIKYFTYSSVFFLPLGFATSIYSMQAAPSKDVIGYMVICAIVALVALLIAIATLPMIIEKLFSVKEGPEDFGRTAKTPIAIATLPMITEKLFWVKEWAEDFFSKDGKLAKSLQGRKKVPDDEEHSAVEKSPHSSVQGDHPVSTSSAPTA